MSPTTQPPFPPPVHTARCRAQSTAACDGACIIGQGRPVPRVALVGIDIDGVVVPETFPGDVPAGFTGYPYHGPNSVGDTIDTTVWLNPEHGRWLAELVDHGAELVWASTWREVASQFVAPRLGLPAGIPFIDVGTHTGVMFGHSLKQYEVAAYVDAQSLAWLDDHFGGKDFIWAADRSEEGIPTLLIQTSPAEGLQREHIDALIIWLEAQQLPPVGDEQPIDPWLHVHAITEEGVHERLENASVGVPDRDLLHGLIAQRISYRSMDCVNLIIQLLLAAASYARHLAAAHENDLGLLYVQDALGTIPEITDRLIADRSVRDNAVRVAFWALAQFAQHTRL